MRLVRILGGSASKSETISEAFLDDLIKNWSGTVARGKNSFELVRLLRFNEKIQQNELIIVYHDNRILRSRNTWFEWRCLNALAKELDCSWYHSVNRNKSIKDSDKEILTEVDGINIENDSIGCEIKHTRFSYNMLEFYESKAKQLALQELHLVGLEYPNNLNVLLYPHLRFWKIFLDKNLLKRFYEKDFFIPAWFRTVLGPRHFKFLLNNGRWEGNKRRIGDTPKSSAEEKIQTELKRIKKKSGKFPVRIYYSLARSLDPIGEFRGKGWMSPPIVFAFDFDLPKHQHVIGIEPGCQICNSQESKEFGIIIRERFEEEGFTIKQLFSGSKGFHYYILDESSNMVKTVTDVNCITQIIDRYKIFDDFRGIKAQQWDFHRIFKLPGSVDASTGQIIVETETSNNKLKFSDQLVSLN